MRAIWSRYALGLFVGLSWVTVVGPCLSAAPEFPPAFEAGGREVILVAHGEGAQIYECKADTSGHPVWVFREPIATLLKDDKTIGRHFAGPNWELSDGSGVKGKVLASAPSASPQDIALLKLDAVDHHGEGPISRTGTILRLNTRGGVLTGPCDQAGEFRSVPYSADYVFLR